MRLTKRIGIIGCGIMGGAILEGLIRKGILSPMQVTVYDKILPRARALARRWKVRMAKSDRDVVTASDIVVLAIKPQEFSEASLELRGAFTKRHLLITILAGTPLAKVRRAVGSWPKIIRAMPNLGAQAGEAITALTGSQGPSLTLAETIFSGCGKTIRLPEKYFDLVTAVSGSGPGYFFLLMEVLCHEAIVHGLSEKVARDLAVQTCIGSGLLARSSLLSPAELRKQVTSKGGTTEAALRVFEKEGLAKIISKGVRAALRRGKELSR